VLRSTLNGFDLLRCPCRRLNATYTHITPVLPACADPALDTSTDRVRLIRSSACGNSSAPPGPSTAYRADRW